MKRVEPRDLPPDVIARALDGEADAFRRFYRRYDPTVRWAVGMRVYCWPQLASLHEDIVQEVWCELIRRRCKRLRYHDGSRGVPFHRFLAIICARYGWKIAKRELGHPTHDLEPVDEGDDWKFAMQLMHADLLRQLVKKIDHSLGETDRRLFEGYYIRGDKLKDVGARLGLKEDAVYQRKKRLQKKLRELAGELLGKPPASLSSDLVAVVLGLLIALTRSGLGGGV